MSKASTTLTVVPAAKQHPKLFKDGIRHTIEHGNHTYHLTQAQHDALVHQNDQLKSDLYRMLTWLELTGGLLVASSGDMDQDALAELGNHLSVEASTAHDKLVAMTGNYDMLVQGVVDQ